MFGEDGLRAIQEMSPSRRRQHTMYRRQRYDVFFYNKISHVADAMVVIGRQLTSRATRTKCYHTRHAIIVAFRDRARSGAFICCRLPTSWTPTARFKDSQGATQTDATKFIMAGGDNADIFERPQGRA